MRRSGAHEKARCAYEGLAWQSADSKTRSEASRWRARVLELSGRAEEAVLAWVDLGEHARDPADRVRAWDRVALALAREGKHEAAKQVLSRCRDREGGPAAELSERGRRVAHALANMHTPRVLNLLDWPGSRAPELAGEWRAAEKKTSNIELDYFQVPGR